MSRVTKISIRALHLGKSVTFNCADMSIEQSFSPTWSEQQAYGKMDPIVAYSHTGREASFNCVVLAHTVGSAKSLQSKVDNLIKFQYPKYKSQGSSGMVLSSPPFFRVSALGGKMYNAMEGYINSFTISPGSSEDIVPLLSPNNYFYERKYTIEFTLKILHKGLPGWNGNIEPGGNGNSFVFTAQTARTPAIAEAAQSFDPAAVEAHNRREAGLDEGFGDPAAPSAAPVDITTAAGSEGKTGSDNAQDVNQYVAPLPSPATSGEPANNNENSGG